jgi:hypothetical protein
VRLTAAKQGDHDIQAGLYLAGRWLEGDPAREFCSAQIAKPGPRGRKISTSLVATTRTAGQLRGALARIAQAASQINAYHERFGPDRPWDSQTPPDGSAAPGAAPITPLARAARGYRGLLMGREKAPGSALLQTVTEAWSQLRTQDRGPGLITTHLVLVHAQLPGVRSGPPPRLGSTCTSVRTRIHAKATSHP